MRTYSSAWNRWVHWCGQRQIDPRNASINDILDYLTAMFGRGSAARTVGGEKSAISAFHPTIGGFTVGDHPLITQLMKSVRRNRPMQSRYRVIWDVSTVLKLLQSIDNDTVSIRLLGWKTATLTAIASAKRGGELAQLDIGQNHLCRGEDKLVFYFDKSGKTQKDKAAAPSHSLHPWTTLPSARSPRSIPTSPGRWTEGIHLFTPNVEQTPNCS